MHYLFIQDIMLKKTTSIQYSLYIQTIKQK